MLDLLLALFNAAGVLLYCDWRTLHVRPGCAWHLATLGRRDALIQKPFVA
jgi:hypothetical protein